MTREDKVQHHLKRNGVMATELPEALLSLPADDRKSVVDWLRDCEKDARFSEPEVGIFANLNMADAFSALAAIVEDAVPTEPAGAIKVTQAEQSA